MSLRWYRIILLKLENRGYSISTYLRLYLLITVLRHNLLSSRIINLIRQVVIFLIIVIELDTSPAKIKSPDLLEEIDDTEVPQYSSRDYCDFLMKHQDKYAVYDDVSYQ